MLVCIVPVLCGCTCEDYTGVEVVRRMGHEVQTDSIRQYGGQTGPCIPVTRDTSRKPELELFKNIIENMSVQMEEILKWDIKSVMIDFAWNLFQFVFIYFLGKSGVSVFLIVLVMCLLVGTSAAAMCGGPEFGLS